MSHESSDPYWKLRPSGATPHDDLCHCVPCKSIKLSDHLTTNPLFCLSCNGEVLPERLGFDKELSEEIASWLNVYHSLHLLWLDSGEYEPWAKARLLDPNGEVNIRGRQVVAQLNRLIPTYYHWFQDESVDDYQSPTHCPVCNGALTLLESRLSLHCDKCRVVILC